LSSTSRPTLCTYWSLTGNTASPHWAETRKRSSFFSQASLETLCNEEDFNAVFISSSSRIGILGDDAEKCGYCESRIAETQNI